MWFAFGYATGKGLVKAVNLVGVVFLLVDSTMIEFQFFCVLPLLFLAHFSTQLPQQRIGNGL
ncbi:hypothetical protein SDC9_165210 [bioreactor metagenome]|uniref:Uncharacterized protein n=1 Tax=bioreactor metagenome TaxID=1076179 RepID=A0A645FTS0_9ZZZZ